eukprot:446332_1
MSAQGAKQYPTEGANAPLISSNVQPSAPTDIPASYAPQPQQNYATIPQQQQQQIHTQPQQGYPAQQKVVYAQQPPPQQVVVVPVTQQGYIPPHQQTVVVVQPNTQPQVNYTRIISRFPQQCFCARCQKVTQTRTQYVTGLATWAVAGGVCLVGCWLGCCLIPFCIDDLKDVEHRCSVCGTFVGAYKVIR